MSVHENDIQPNDNDDEQAAGPPDEQGAATPSYSEGSELGQIREIFEREQLKSGFEIEVPGYHGQFVLSCKPVSDAEYELIERKVEQAGKRDKKKLRNTKLDILIAGVVDVLVASSEGADHKPLYQVAPEIVGAEEIPVRFGDPRLTQFLTVLGKPDNRTARQQLLCLLKNEPIRLNNLFGEYYELASGEVEDIVEELQGE